MNEINFITVDAEKINNDMIKDFENATGETFYPGDERRIFLLQEGQVIVALKSDINFSAKQNLLRYAVGEALDAWGERVNTPRLQANKSNVLCRITLSSAQTSSIIIEKGKRITPDGVLFFQLQSDIIISSGITTADAIYEATEAGTNHNSFTPGQIKTIVDPIPYVASIENIETSSGGTDIEPDDDGVNVWSGYRERIRLAPAGFSTAGPEDAYIYWAKKADANILDVKPTSPSPGTVKIVVLMKNGELPTQSVLDAVYNICNGKKVRPLNDLVTTVAPTVISYNINLTYYIASERAADESNIRASIESAGGTVDAYNLWQSGKIGRPINPDYLKNLLSNSGAFRTEITSPVFTTINEDEIAKVGTITLTYGGLI